jgi:hypothetical protein
LCLSPLIRSATTADIRDSIAPSIATVTAGDKSLRINDGVNGGKDTVGRPDGTPPNRLPTVSTGRLNSQTPAVPATSATMVPGIRGTKRVTTRMIASDRTPTGRRRDIDGVEVRADRGHARQEFAGVLGDPAARGNRESACWQSAPRCRW